MDRVLMIIQESFTIDDNIVDSVVCKVEKRKKEKYKILVVQTKEKIKKDRKKILTV